MNDTGGSFDRYLTEIREHALLAPEEEVELARRIRDGDDAALDRLVNANLRFVVSIARRYARRGVPMDELVNEGNLGLIEAARRFDESRGVRFVSYAVWWIRQSILAALERDASVVRIPSRRRSEARRVASTARRLSQQLGRPATSAEVAAELGITDREVRRARSLRSGDVSLDAALGPSADTTLLERIPDPRSEDPTRTIARSDLHDALEASLSRLPPREAEVVRRYFGLHDTPPATLADIGNELGISRERAAALRDRALARLRLGAAGRNLRNFRGD